MADETKPSNSNPMKPVSPQQLGLGMELRGEVEQGPNSRDSSQAQRHQRRVYPLDAHELTEEQIAVAFAMTSRRPEPFDEIARQVSEEKAADFHERWVLGYGHASVAEHAVVHLAVENVSRLACDALEDNRLASYTEKSSRYQVMPGDYFHVPEELDDRPALKQEFVEACETLFAAYTRLIDDCLVYLKGVYSQRQGERDGVYNLRLRRIATDHCRAVLPAATLTNVGVTANARTLEHAVSKLLSGKLMEENQLGLEVREQGRQITPTLIKYAEKNEYLAQAAGLRLKWVDEVNPDSGTMDPSPDYVHYDAPPQVRLVHWDPQAEEKISAALLYGGSHLTYEQVWHRIQDMSLDARQEIIDEALSGLGSHDAPVRELEVVDYTFEYLMDYGAYREFKRHRMQSYFPQLLTVAHGYRVPSVVAEAGLTGEFEEAVAAAERAFWNVHQESPVVAQYLVTHAHNRRVLSKLNLRECYHLFKLRTSEMAHFSIREPVKEALRLASEKHPQLFRHLQLRD